MYERILRPIIELLTYRDPEIAHDLLLPLLDRIARNPLIAEVFKRRLCVSDIRLRQMLFKPGRDVIFPNPFGVAAGLDKNGVALKGWEMIGFGFVEIGTILPELQTGNQRPRIRRESNYRGLQNAMGFPSKGVEAVAKNCLSASRLSIPIAVNVGKMKDTKNESAAEDACRVLDVLDNLCVNYAFEVHNLSSPNTPGLRDLQRPDALRNYLEYRVKKAEANAKQKDKADRKAIVFKLAPDIGWDGEREDWTTIDSIIQVLVEGKADGVVLSNTTTNHSHPPFSFGAKGGYSGPRLYPRTLSLVRHFRALAPSDFVIIACGGIQTSDKANEVIDNGANLIEALTGIIYEGPVYARNRNQGLLDSLERNNLSSLSAREMRR